MIAITHPEQTSEFQEIAQFPVIDGGKYISCYKITYVYKNWVKGNHTHFNLYVYTYYISGLPALHTLRSIKLSFLRVYVLRLRSSLDLPFKLLCKQHSGAVYQTIIKQFVSGASIDALVAIKLFVSRSENYVS